MKMDRFDAMVSDAMDGYQWNARKRKSPVNLTAIAAKLLRNEHAAVRRMVKDEMVEVAGPMGRAHNQAVERILAALARRAKGGTK